MSEHEENCSHPDPVFLYPATDEEGYELAVMKCPDCKHKWAEGV